MLAIRKPLLSLDYGFYRNKEGDHFSDVIIFLALMGIIIYRSQPNQPPCSELSTYEMSVMVSQQAAEN
ncbi:MAG TPA: hypothetical protein PLB14_08350 [Smithellaceae bacterium]|jgi:hypothetical protein|nr:hypothetical protein [Smithellaceae bacterium]HPV49704.1 hypothetical protein [Smithellaceae bacterium]